MPEVNGRAGDRCPLSDQKGKEHEAIVQARNHALPVLVVLLTTGQGAWPASVAVSDLHAYAMDDRVEVRWTTPVPTVSQVECGEQGALTRRVGEDPWCLRGSTRERLRHRPVPGYANNHRATVTDVRAWPVHVRVVGRTQTGARVESKVVKVAKPGPARAVLEPGRVGIHVDRGQWRDRQPPITVGVPMPEGALAEVEHLRMVYEGRPVPLQASVVSRYLDGRSVKWLRVTFLAPEGAEAVVLEYGRPAPPPRTSLRAKVSGGVARVETGAASLRLAEDGTGELCSRAATIRLPRGVLRDFRGKLFEAKAERVTLEESGPVMAALLVSGHHVAEDGEKHFAFEERIYAYAGKAYVRVDHTFGNDLCRHDAPCPPYHPSALMAAVQSLHLELDRLDARPATVGLGRERCELKPGQRVFQREDFEWVQEPGEARGRRIDGVVRLGPARVLVKSFWEQWPTSVVRDGAAVRVGLLPKLPPTFYADRPDEDQIKLYYHIRDGYHTFREGFTKTHTLYLDVSGDAASESLISDEPVACADPRWIETTGVLRGLAVSVRDQFPELDTGLDRGISTFREIRDLKREYGLMNFGDWFGERKHNWGNLEYDNAHGFLAQFVRTADARFFRIASDLARHQRDVDTRHYAKDQDYVGQQWMHCTGHTSGYFPFGFMGMGYYASAAQSGNCGHTWNRGILEHYLLGGDHRSWDTAMLLADWVGGPRVTEYDYHCARYPGWMCLVVLPAYAATEDPFYLNATHLIVRGARRKAKASGDRGFWYRELDGGHCRCKGEKHWGEAGFMLGIQMAGLHHYYEITGDKQVAEDIVKIARFIVGTMYVPDRMMLRYSSCPKSPVGGDMRCVEGLAFAANYSKDPKLAEAAAKLYVTQSKMLRTYGKSGGGHLVFAAQALHELARLPGGSFAERRKVIEAQLRNPARRWLPTIVPNPDFEQDLAGWRIREPFKVTRSTPVFHSGVASMRIEGVTRINNEYVLTTPNAPGSPSDINWLVPGREYRLTAWVRVDRLAPGTPSPSVRIQFRDASGSRTAAFTNSYDTSKMGTWQQLTCDFTVPQWNVRNYVALNTHRTESRQPVGGLLYLDDVSLVPVARANADTYATIRLDAGSAACSGGTKPLREGLSGAGIAVFELEVRRPGSYRVLAKVNAASREVARLMVGDRALEPIRGERRPCWAKLGTVELRQGRHRATLQITDDAAWIGRVVLTTDPGDE